MKRAPGPRPYPNVLAYERLDGTITYLAYFPYYENGGKQQKNLGRYANPEAAYSVVLDAQAEGHAAKAAAYRAEAEQMRMTVPDRRLLKKLFP
jgi:hypothetical protein